ncbi:hypothetical protein [Lentzea sp.]|uniref:hypothetical protein n=1 Tax=Lentzea sp. TaxID=56099 RepID=UPI002ED29EA9
MIDSAGVVRMVLVLAGAVVLYRHLVSPIVRWAARELGAGDYPATALNGTYPEAPVPRSAWRPCAVIGLLTLVAALLGPWRVSGLLWIPAVALAVVVWKYTTADYDAASDIGWQRTDRVVVTVLGVAGVLVPFLAVAAVVAICGRLGGWTHHSKSAIRVVKAAFAHSLALGPATLFTGADPARDQAGLLVLLATVHLSHYVFACHSKIVLGRRPWSWANENRINVLAASAYSWGWAGFLPEDTVRRVVRALAPLSRWLNWGTLVVEGLGAVAFLHRDLLVVAAAGAAFFNVVVAFSAGILFLENILLGSVIAVSALSLPPPVEQAAFGALPWTVSLALLGVVLLGRAWKPTALGWWDTPLTERVYWRVVTAGGRTCSLDNGFLSPFDREYARSAGNPLTADRYVTFPLGGVEDEELRDRLFALDREDPHADLAAIAARFGLPATDPRIRERHAEYVARLFGRLALGTPKSPLPEALRWLKMPGGHLYYWLESPRYRLSDGPVVRVQVRHRKDHFDQKTATWTRLCDEAVMEIPVSTAWRRS